jgi:hypothetical protein
MSNPGACDLKRLSCGFNLTLDFQIRLNMLIIQQLN